MYSCEVCGKSYHWPSDLKRHAKAKHTGSSPLETKLNCDGVNVIHFPEVKEPWVRIRHPGTIILQGPSSSGKTTFLLRFLTHLSKMIDQDIQEIIWCYGIEQGFHKDIKNRFPQIQFVAGLPDVKTFDSSKTRIAILDDLMNDTRGNIIGDLFCRGSHHLNTTVFYITQNLFPRHKEHRDISLNSKYFVLFKSPRSCSQVGVLGTQMGKHDFIKQSYDLATAPPYGYLFIDVTQEINDKLRVRTNIFPDDDVNIVYLP